MMIDNDNDNEKIMVMKQTTTITAKKIKEWNKEVRIGDSLGSKHL